VIPAQEFPHGWWVPASAWVIAFFLYRRGRSPASLHRVCEIRWRRWFRGYALLVVVLMSVGGLGMLIVSLAPRAIVPSGWDFTRWEGVALGLTLPAIGCALWGIIRMGEMLVAQEGLRAAHTFVSWSEIQEVRDDDGNLYLRSPGFRRWWTGGSRRRKSSCRDSSSP
jgi:hypothetical protein